MIVQKHLVALCQKNNLELVQYLYSNQNGDLDLITENVLGQNFSALIYCVQDENNIDIIVWLHEMSKGINYDRITIYSRAFYHACANKNDNLLIPKLLLELEPGIDINYGNGQALRNACLAGNVTIAKFVHSFGKFGFDLEDVSNFELQCTYSINLTLDVYDWLSQVSKQDDEVRIYYEWLSSALGDKINILCNDKTN